MPALFTNNEKTGEDDRPSEFTPSTQYAYGVRRIFSDDSEAFDVILYIKVGKEETEISIACQDEDAAVALLESIEDNAIESLTEVIEP